MTGMHVVCGGVVMIVSLDENGWEHVTQLVGVGGILDAADSLAGNLSYSVSAKALTETAIAFIKPEVLHQRLEKEPSLVQKLCKQVAVQIQLLEKRCRWMQTRSVYNRVVCVLQELVQLCGLESNKKVSIPIRLRRFLLAQLAGTTQETISRVMASMQKSRVITRSDDLITIQDMEKLKNCLLQQN